MGTKPRNGARIASADVLKLATNANEIRCKLGDIVNAHDALSRLMAFVMPGKLAYHIAKIGRLALVEFKAFHEQQNALIKELGAERDATELEKKMGSDPKVWEVTTDNRDAFKTRLKDLLESDVVLAWRPVHIDDLTAATVTSDKGEQKPFAITPIDLSSLNPYLTADDAAKEPAK